MGSFEYSRVRSCMNATKIFFEYYAFGGSAASIG